MTRRTSLCPLLPPRLPPPPPPCCLRPPSWLAWLSRNRSPRICSSIARCWLFEFQRRRMSKMQIIMNAAISSMPMTILPMIHAISVPSESSESSIEKHSNTWSCKLGNFLRNFLRNFSAQMSGKITILFRQKFRGNFPTIFRDIKCHETQQEMSANPQ